MLGIDKISSGRMGNRLFHYNFLRQISEKTKISYFNIKFPEHKYFEGLGRINKNFFSLNKKIRMNSLDIKTLGKDKFFDLVKEKNNQGFNIVFDPPLLGDLFFDYLFYSPNRFIVVKERYRKKFKFDIKKIIVGIHFRGTDFKSWDPNACLKFNYYQKAIQYCINYFNNKKLVFIIFTDDLELSSLLKTIDYLKTSDSEYYLSDNLNTPVYDFYQMSQCDVLISSPSTFSILAGATGKVKKIIHSQEWLDYSIDRNDKFWVDFSRTKNSFYSLWRAF